MVIVMDGQTRAIDEVLLKKDLSGQLKGQLQSAIAGYEWSTAQVKLLGAGEERLATPNNEGIFLFELLQPGSYLLEVQAAGHVKYVEPVLVGRDGQTELENMTLTPAYLPMVGLAFLDDQQEQNTGVHQGIRVDAFVGDELVASTQTDASGRYRIMAGAIDYRLKFVRSGYEERELNVVWRSDCGRDICFEPADEVGVSLADHRGVVLTSLPSQIRGTVRLTPFGTPERLQAVDLSLRNDANDMVVASARPSGMGEFIFENVKAGQYTVEVTARGYTAQRRSIYLRPADTLTLNEWVIPHRSSTDEAVMFSGVVNLDGAVEHGGTRVQIVMADTNQVMATPVTDAAGRFSAALAPDEVYGVVLSRVGYISPDANQLGQFSWQQDAFKNEAGDGVNIVLQATPLDGTITVPIDVKPDWIPVEQRFAQVTVQQLDGTYRRVTEGVTANTPALF